MKDRLAPYGIVSVAGDLLDADGPPLPEADIYTLTRVLHDWDDAHAVRNSPPVTPLVRSAAASAPTAAAGVSGSGAGAGLTAAVVVGSLFSTESLPPARLTCRRRSFASSPRGCRARTQHCLPLWSGPTRTRAATGSSSST